MERLPRIAVGLRVASRARDVLSRSPLKPWPSSLPSPRTALTCLTRNHYSTMSFLVLSMNARTSVFSFVATRNLSRVALRCPMKSCQSRSLIPASRRAQEIDEQLLLPAHAVFSAMLPEPFKLRVV